jgi:undecaprenyl-diphosphatase
MFWFYRKNAPLFAYGSVFLAAAVAFSRIWLCVHYVSDVVVGSVFGIAVGILTVYLCDVVQKRFFKNKN